MEVQKQIVSWAHLGVLLHELCRLIESDAKYWKCVAGTARSGWRYVYGIPRGGLVAATYLAHHLDLELIVQLPSPSLSRLTHVLVVDDLVDTGITMQELQKVYGLFDSAVLYRKPHTLYNPTYHVAETTKWVVFPYELHDEIPNRPTDAQPKVVDL